MKGASMRIGATAIVAATLNVVDQTPAQAEENWT